MWTLIILHVLAGSATSNNSQPIVYSGYTFQTGFKSEQACEVRKKVLLEMNAKRNASSNLAMNVRDGIIEIKCEKD